jgi:hypothetical protein
MNRTFNPTVRKKQPWIQVGSVTGAHPIQVRETPINTQKLKIPADKEPRRKQIALAKRFRYWLLLS